MSYCHVMAEIKILNYIVYKKMKKINIILGFTDRA